MRIIFDLKDFKTKIYMSSFIIIAFFLFNLTIPDYEFDNISYANCKVDRLYYTIGLHTGIHGLNSLKPKSVRSKTLAIIHMLLAYSILLL